MANFSLYTEFGLTVQSNNPDIIKRDNNGNVIIYSGNDDNQKLLIETVKERYTNRSVIDTIDTQFRYFTFPVADVGVDVTTAIPLPEIPDISSILPDTETGDPPPVTFDRYNDIVPTDLIRRNIQTLFDRDPAVLKTNNVKTLFNNFNQALGKAEDELPGVRDAWIFWFKKVSSGNRTDDLTYVLDATIDNLVVGRGGVIE
jgi:hypothetical protein